MKNKTQSNLFTGLRRLAPLVAGVSLALFSSTILAQSDTARNHTDQAYVVPIGGQDVPVREGLQSVLPEGWYFYIKPATPLPSSMSWKSGDKWTSIVESMAHDNGLALSFNWDDKGLVIRAADKPAQVEPTVGFPAAPLVRPATATATKQPATIEKPGASAPDTDAARPTAEPPYKTPVFVAPVTAPTQTEASGPTVVAAPVKRTESLPDTGTMASQKAEASTPSRPAQATALVPALATGSTRATPTLHTSPLAAVSPGVARLKPEPLPLEPLVIHAGQPVKTALSQFLKAQGYELEWNAPPGPVAGRELRYDGDSVTEVLGEALGPEGLRAEVYQTSTGGQRVFVTQSNASLN
jgi:hypothetical protein